MLTSKPAEGASPPPSDLSDLIGPREAGDKPIGPHLWSTLLPSPGRFRIMQSIRK